MSKKRKVKKIKLKTHRGAAKRFKVTSTGKIIRGHSGKRHLMGTKAPSRMRHLRRSALVSPADAAKVHRMLPYA
jgi:large subunit ribosomal protein L35